MTLYIDKETSRFVVGATFKAPVDRVEFKRGDAAKINIVFVNEDLAEALEENALIRFGIKEAGNYDGEFLVFSDSYTLDGTVYSVSPSFNTEALNDILNSDNTEGNDVAYHDAMLEISWSEDEGDSWQSSLTITARLHNDVIKGIEGTPSAGPDPDDFVEARAVLYDREQTLSEPEQLQGRDNLSAAIRPLDGFPWLGFTVAGISNYTALNGSYTPTGEFEGGKPIYGKNGLTKASSPNNPRFEWSGSVWDWYADSNVQYVPNALFEAWPWLVGDWIADGSYAELTGSYSLTVDAVDGEVGQLAAADGMQWIYDGNSWNEVPRLDAPRNVFAGDLVAEGLLRANGNAVVDGDFSVNGQTVFNDAVQVMDLEAYGQVSLPSQQATSEVSALTKSLGRRLKPFVDPRSTRQITETFVRGSLVTGDIGQWNWAFAAEGAGAVSYQTAGFLPIGRRIRLTTGTTANQRIYLASQTTSASGADSACAVTYFFNFPSGMSWSDMRLRFGYSGATLPYSGGGEYMLVEYDSSVSANWRLVYDPSSGGSGVLNAVIGAINTGDVNNRNHAITIVGTQYNEKVLGGQAGHCRIITTVMNTGGGIANAHSVEVDLSTAGALFNPRMYVELMTRTAAAKSVEVSMVSLDFATFHALFLSLAPF